MIKNFSLVFLLSFSLNLFSQIGINTTTPKASLDVSAKNIDGTSPEGFITPRLTGNQIKAAESQYTESHKGTIIYATEAVTTPSEKTANITTKGYYYFDGSIWQMMANGNTL